MSDEDLARRVAARFLQADTLTKSWLLKVKKGWNTVIRSPHEVTDKFLILQEFLKNLREQVLFQQHGFDIPFEGSTGRVKFEQLLAKTQDKLKKLSDAYIVELSDYHLAFTVRDNYLVKVEDATGDVYRRLGSEKFLEKHPEYRPIHDEWLKTMNTLDKWKWKPEKSFSPVTQILEEMMTFLYADAKARADYEEMGGEVDDSHLTVDKVFELQGVKVVIVDDTVDRFDIRDYIKYLDRAHKLLASKGFGKLWYGVVFIEKKLRSKTPEEIELGKEWGYNNTEAAGEYRHGSDRFYIQQTPSNYVVDTAIHELGHRYWYKFMKPAQRARFNALVQTRASTRFRDFPQGPTTDEGELKPVTPFGTYAESNIEEAFAEVFEGYVSGKDLTRDQLESFRSILSSVEGPTLLESIMRRYLTER